MREVSREWLEFLREQYPKGSRVRLTKMGNDPHPIPPGSMGTLKYIDDVGQFHVKWDNGRGLALIIGEDQFQILPPEPQTIKFYMPLTAQLYAYDDWGDLEEYGNDLDGSELRDYQSCIHEALLENQMPEEKNRGLMHWYDKPDGVNTKVQSVMLDVESRDGQLWGVAECKVNGTLLPEEKEALAEYISGQASDGWGEGFEQRAIKLNDGELYVSLWNSSNWSIQTEEERFSPDSLTRLPDLCWSVLPGEGTLICIKRGESGYYPSDWSTKDRAQNRWLADYNNQRRGITPAQEQAMLTGSMCGWDVPGADPKWYEEHQEQNGGEMTLALGNFVMEHIFYPSSQTREFLDPAKVGAAYRQKDGNTFCDGNFIRLSSPLDLSQNSDPAMLPDRGDYGIRVKLASRNNMEGIWVGFPDTSEYMDSSHPDELLLALDALEAETLTECIAVDVDCCLPQLRDILSQYDSAAELIRHAIDFGYVWAEQGQGEPRWLDKWQAVMELEDCHQLDYALDLAQNLHCYNFMPRDMEVAEYGRLLAKQDGVYPNDALLAECFDAEGYANQKMKNLGLSAAEHGYVSWNGSEILYEYSQPPSSPTMSM